jgi:Rrf2 family iron-sulfur cluster assembly transcriptional regulator
MIDPDGRTTLALAVVVDVALHGLAGPVGGAAVAERLGQNPRGIEPLLQALARAGVLASSRGRKGGYRLARARREITAGEIARAVAGEARRDESGALVARVIAPVMETAAAAALERLDAVTVEALCREATKAGLAPAPAAPLTWAI